MWSIRMCLKFTTIIVPAHTSSTYSAQLNDLANITYATNVIFTNDMLCSPKSNFSVTQLNCVRYDIYVPLRMCRKMNSFLSNYDSSSRWKCKWKNHWRHNRPTPPGKKTINIVYVTIVWVKSSRMKKNSNTPHSTLHIINWVMFAVWIRSSSYVPKNREHVIFFPLCSSISWSLQYFSSNKTLSEHTTNKQTNEPKKNT